MLGGVIFAIWYTSKKSKEADTKRKLRKVEDGRSKTDDKQAQLEAMAKKLDALNQKLGAGSK